MDYLHDSLMESDSICSHLLPLYEIILLCIVSLLYKTIMKEFIFWGTIANTHLSKKWILNVWSLK